MSKVTKSRTIKAEYEIRLQEGQFLIPTFFAEKMGFDTKKAPHYFNDQGSVCILTNKLYELYRDNKLVSQHASDEDAQKNLEKDWNY